MLKPILHMYCCRTSSSNLARRNWFPSSLVELCFPQLWHKHARRKTTGTEIKSGIFYSSGQHHTDPYFVRLYSSFTHCCTHQKMMGKCAEIDWKGVQQKCPLFSQIRFFFVFKEKLYCGPKLFFLISGTQQNPSDLTEPLINSIKRSLT